MLAALILLSALFGLLLAVKSLAKLEFCVICGAVSGTWVTLLVLLSLGYYANRLVIALLIGQSIVGAYYRLKTQISDRLAVFSLPFLLTATVIGYALLAVPRLREVVIVLAALWTATGLLYVYREHEYARSVFDEAVACCRDW